MEFPAHSGRSGKVLTPSYPAFTCDNGRFVSATHSQGFSIAAYLTPTEARGKQIDWTSMAKDEDKWNYFEDEFVSFLA